MTDHEIKLDIIKKQSEIAKLEICLDTAEHELECLNVVLANRKKLKKLSLIHI